MKYSAPNLRFIAVYMFHSVDNCFHVFSHCEHQKVKIMKSDQPHDSYNGHEKEKLSKHGPLHTPEVDSRIRVCQSQLRNLGKFLTNLLKRKDN